MKLITVSFNLPVPDQVYQTWTNPKPDQESIEFKSRKTAAQASRGMSVACHKFGDWWSELADKLDPEGAY